MYVAPYTRPVRTVQWEVLGVTPHIYSIYSAEGLVPATYAYLRLTDTDLDYNGQLLGDIKQNKGLFILFEMTKGIG